ncbi:trehalose-phosphatase [Ahrensia sp. R2A130]|uniref:trehalose-phosphatase n=1 Tax=Ahrensia sp. R2A130 TaxID=744979 RepID=UPI0001E0F895|nr:trehalose-phosphatase [Ahrensia sp. R2A130]EFL89026.1 trehalose-phosphatase [Ahrensia sp. R2A130]
MTDHPTIPNSPALFLDFDGTLVELAETPGAVLVPDTLANLLKRLNTCCGGAIAFVTGRSIIDLDALLGDAPANAVGVHGAEWRLAGGEISGVEGAGFDTERDALRAFAEENTAIVMEEKSGGLTLHYRRDPTLQDDAHAVMDTAFANRSDFETFGGHMMVEARRVGVDKGAGIKRLMAEPQFTGRTPIFLGDDVTDEDGFAAVNTMDGVSIKVGQGDTSAAYRVADIPSVYDYLEALAGSR